MLDLLIAILIALGCSVGDAKSTEELKAHDPVAFDRATQIMETGTYKTVDGGGIIIIETGGD